MLGQYNIYKSLFYISFIYIILPQHLNFHYFSLLMTKIHTTVVRAIEVEPTVTGKRGGGVPKLTIQKKLSYVFTYS